MDTEDHPRSLRHGAFDEAQGGPALPPGQGPLCRRRGASRHALHGHRAQPASPRQDRRTSTPTTALEVPGVLAVITGKTLEQFNLHWMPTLMSDTQMVLPIEKVMYQAQEVAAVIATEPLRRGRRRRGGRGRLRSAPGGGRPVQGARARRAGAPHRQERQEGQPHLALGGRRPGRHRQGCSQQPDVVVKQDIYIPRIHVASIETCGCVADFDKCAGEAHRLHDHPGAARDPHRGRAGGGTRRACPRRGSASSRPTSAAASAARCRSIPATSSPSRPRSSPASRSSGSRIGWRTSRPTPSPATTT